MIVVRQADINRLWLDNNVPDNIPKLPINALWGVLIFFDGGELIVNNLKIEKDDIRSISFTREFPLDRDTPKALLLAKIEDPFKQMELF